MFESSGPLGQRLSLVSEHEGTRIIQSTLGVSMGCYLIVGYHFIIQYAGAHLYMRVGRGASRVKCFAQEHNKMTRSELKPGPLDP